MNINNNKLKILLNKILSTNSIIYANKFELTVEEIISISNLVVSLPYSSLNYESYAANKNTLILDYDNNYNESHIYFNKAKILKIVDFKIFKKNISNIFKLNNKSKNKELYFDKIFDIENSISLKLLKKEI